MEERGKGERGKKKGEERRKGMKGMKGRKGLKGYVEPKIAEMFGVAEPIAGEGSAFVEIGHG